MLIIGQLQVQAATAENEEQYTFSNIIYIAQHFFDKQLFLKGRQIN